MSATALGIRPHVSPSSYWLEGLSLGTNGALDWFVREKMGGNLQRNDSEMTIFRIPICDNHRGVIISERNDNINDKIYDSVPEYHPSGLCKPRSG